MQSSCDQARLIQNRYGYSTGTSTRKRCTTVTKVISVAAPIRLAMMISSSRSRMRRNIRLPPSLRAKRSNPDQTRAVIAGLVPVIHVLLPSRGDKDVDGRVKPGHDGVRDSGLLRRLRSSQ